MTTPVAVEVPDVESTAPLTALDRCDRCGAQAYVRTQHEAGDLLWCAHHARQHGEKLHGSITQDETARLTERPSNLNAV
jgi:hypothetical protein